jgi:hypothetical protein
MATSNSSTQRNATPDLEAAGDRVREANDRFVSASRKVTGAYLDGLEKYATGVAQAERKLGEQSQIEPFGQLLNVHAKLTEDFVKASVSATRELISA